MEQLILHLIGDYLTQSDWMADNKTKRFWPAWIHACVYTLPFLLITKDHSYAYWVILLTHFAIDRYRLARYLCWAKNFLAPYMRIRTFAETIKELKDTREIDPGPTSTGPELQLIISEQKRHVRVNPPFEMCSATGYGPDRPIWLAVWLMIIADNTLHLAINYAALRWL